MYTFDMEVRIDPDVKSVAEFMQRNVEASRLVGVASCLAGLAPLLWGDYRAESVSALRLAESPITLDGPRRQPASTE